MRPADPKRSRIVLIGSSRYADPELADLPAVATTVRDLSAFYTDPHAGVVPRRHCAVLLDAPGLESVGNGLAVSARAAEDLLLVHYIGHGLVSGRKQDLYLALPGTVWDSPDFSALEYGKLRDAVLRSPARVKIIILDCCFSGRAFSRSMYGGPSGASLAELEVEGAYVLTSAGQSQVSQILPGEEHTAFSGRLLRLLWEGIDNGPALLTIEDLYQALRHRMRIAHLSTPERRLTGDAERMPLTANRAGVLERPRRHADPPRRRMRRSGTGRTSGLGGWRRPVPLTALGALVIAVTAWSLVPDASPKARPSAHVTSPPPSAPASASPATARTVTTTATTAWRSRRLLTIPGPFDAARFSPDGTILAMSGTDRTLTLRDMSTGAGKVLRLGSASATLRPAVFSPDGRLVAAWAQGDRAIRLWDRPTGRWLTFNPAHPAPVWAAAFSPDSRTMATGGDDGDVILWDLARQRRITALRRDGNGRIWSLGISPDGKLLAAGSADGHVHLWNLRNHTYIRALTATPEGVWGLAFNPSGTRLAAVAADKRIALWDARTLELKATFRDDHTRVYGLDFSADGRFLSSCGEPDTTRVIDVTARRKVAEYPGSLSFSPTGRSFATVTALGDVQVWRMTGA
ncbi:WD40 repeat domain-containing protein [Actinomadura sp. ATCC 31491]|uniref:WD40 repeat domain-containing protein n=1 Tax=Actinomadura luzonensis TaxID=2805427 RepID=A0ABT0G246_9ACTN|nr:WD40 repeat domain-containing protein [Actinomadura luzonensis]MCK2218650.1 WD40 repeat domain-containing protein [Actinomadura luzonensis]